MSYTKKILKLYYTDHSSSENKEYHVVVEADPSRAGYHVYGMNGPRGRATTKQRKTTVPVTLSAAESIYTNLVDAKRKKGYTTDVSGTPRAGIRFSTEVITGVAPATPAAPAVPPTPLKPAPWFSTAGPADFDTLLGDDEFAVQELPVGIRVLVEVTSSIRLLDTVTGKDWTLPAPVQAEVMKALPDCVVDCTYDAVTSRLAIFDGYTLPGSGPKSGKSAPFESRIAELAKKVSTAATKHLQVMQPYVDEDKFEVVCALQDHGRPRVLLHKLRDPYNVAASDRDEGSMVVHTF